MLRHEDAINDAILRALGTDPEAVNAWPYDDYGFDWYDSSVELYEFTAGRRLTPEEVAAICATGVDLIFVNYAGGGERAYRVGHEGDFRPGKPRACPRPNDTARTMAVLRAKLASRPL